MEFGLALAAQQIGTLDMPMPQNSATLRWIELLDKTPDSAAQLSIHSLAKQLQQQEPGGKTHGETSKVGAGSIDEYRAL